MTASWAPPESPATCGTPHAAASRNTMPKPSCSRPPQRFRHGIEKTSAIPKTVERSDSLTRPRNLTGKSNFRAIRARRFASRPEPAMASWMPGNSSRRLATASMVRSNPFRGTRRLRLRTRGPCSKPNRRRCVRCSLVSRGENRTASTPGGTSIVFIARPADLEASRAG